MLVSKTSHWCCGNRGCGFAAVLTLPEGSLADPICLCGSTMRKTEARPASTYLDFLRDRGELHEQMGSEKES